MSTDVTTKTAYTRGGEVLQPPCGWTEVLLSSIADVRFSGVDKVSRPSEDPIRLCNYVDVYNNDYITSDLEFMRASATTAEIERFRLQRGDVIITKDSETPDDIGVPAIVDYAAPDLVCGYHLAQIRPDHNELDPTFLGKQLMHHRHARRFGRLANGLTRYGLPTSAVNTAPIWRPELLGEQQEIGRILRLLDEAIANTEVVNGKLRLVRTGLLHDLLTRGLGRQGQLRDPAAHPEQFRNSALGRIPQDWDCKTLEEAADWFSGGTPSRSQSSWWEGNIPFLTPKDMKDFELSDTIEHVTEEAAVAGSKVMPTETAFIVVRGMILAHSFPVCLSARPFAFNQDIKAIRGRGELTTRFLAHWLAANSALFLRRATEATHGTKKLDLPEIKRILIGIPGPEEQLEIVRRIGVLDAVISSETRGASKLALLKQGLMADLLTGRVRVPANRENTK